MSLIVYAQTVNIACVPHALHGESIERAWRPNISDGKQKTKQNKIAVSYEIDNVHFGVI